MEILVAMHLFSFKQVHKNHFVLRLILSSLACLILAIGFPIPPDLFYLYINDVFSFISILFSFFIFCL